MCIVVSFDCDGEGCSDSNLCLLCILLLASETALRTASSSSGTEMLKGSL